jgi:hypothetical protein
MRASEPVERGMASVRNSALGRSHEGVLDWGEAAHAKYYEFVVYAYSMSPSDDNESNGGRIGPGLWVKLSTLTERLRPLPCRRTEGYEILTSEATVPRLAEGSIGLQPTVLQHPS